jgi:hypothetical protein
MKPSDIQAIVTAILFASDRISYSIETHIEDLRLPPWDEERRIVEASETAETILWRSRAIMNED